MTRTKFKRLFLVLLAPLLIFGVIFAILENEKADPMTLRCQAFMSRHENCRPTGSGDFDSYVAGQAPAWFDVKVRPYERNSFPKVFVSASQRQIDNVEILTVSPYLGTQGGAGSPLNELRSLTGQRISIIFGVPSERNRRLDPLGCNELDFEESSTGVFTAGLCGIPNGVVRVRFSVGQQELQMLDALKLAINRETEIRRQDLIKNYLFSTPMFVVLFLLVSAAVWIVRRAILYVSAG